MTLTTKSKKTPSPGSLNIPLPQGDSTGAKWLIGAVLAAGKNGCQCECCQLLKRFGGELSSAMLKEETPGGD